MLKNYPRDVGSAQLIFGQKFRPQTSEFLVGTYGKFCASSILRTRLKIFSWRGCKILL